MKLDNNNSSNKHGSIARDDEGGVGANTGSGSATTTEEEEDEETTDGLVAPLFRSVAVQPHFDSAFKAAAAAAARGGTADLGGNAGKSIFQFQQASTITTLLEKTSIAPSTTNANANAIHSTTNCDATLREWKAHACGGTYTLPCYYPRACERRSITCSQMTVDRLLDRLFCCFKKLNIHAQFESSFSTFGLVLRTAEHLELSLLIWYTDRAHSKLYMEVDKRQAGSGCGGAFPLQYICRILKAVKCCDRTLQGDTLCLPQHQEMQRGNVGMPERCRKMGMVVSPCAAKAKSAKQETPAEHENADTMSFTCVGDQSLCSLSTIFQLLQDPMTYCQGLELLSNVSDPDKSGLESSKIFAKVILLGVSPKSHGIICCKGIHETLVRLMQSLAGGDASNSVMTDRFSSYQKDCLLQLALTCLVNAMEVRVKLGGSSSSDGSPMDVEMSATMDSASGGVSAVMDQFLESTKGVVACDILETLLVVVRRANTKPHHAYLSVKALFLLSSENPTICQHVAQAMSMDGGSHPAQRCAVLQEAQEVGTQSHGLLEAECERLSRVLESRH